jgi:hypothetical protein
VTLKITWRQAFAWRLDRQLLEPIGSLPPQDVVRRLWGVQAQVASSAELAVRVRQRSSKPGDVAAALADGRLIKTWAMRGTLHLLTPEDAGAVLSLLAFGRSWEAPSWQKYFGLTPKHWELLRPAVRDALDGRALTREELSAEIVKLPQLAHVARELTSGWGTLFKPLAFQGDIVFGPSQGQRVTFQRPEAASKRWGGVPEPDDGAPRAIAGYLGAFGPATVEEFGAWISRGRVAKKELRRWFSALGNRLTEVEVDGEKTFVLTEHLDQLAAAKPTETLRLLGGFDQWVLGPGTDNVHVLPAPRRWAVSKQSGWIAPVVVLGGVVAGIWEPDGAVARIAWFAEAGKPPRKAIEAEVVRLSAILGRELEPEISVDRLGAKASGAKAS